MHLFGSVVLNFYFYLVPPVYFLKWNHYFSACENFPKSSCQFWKHKSVFLQTLYQSSLLSNITSLCCFSSNIIYFGWKELIKVQIFETSECSDQNSSNSLCRFWNDKSIPLQILTHNMTHHNDIIMTHNSYLSLKLINFLLPIKGSHQ